LSSSRAVKSSRLGPARLGALAALILLALALRAWPLAHGLPRNYVPDSHIVRSALGMARDKDPIPPVGRYSTYPYLLPYLLLPLYGAQYAAGRLAGEWTSSVEYGEKISAEPARAHYIARGLVACFGALGVWATFMGARAAGLGSGAWIAAGLVGTSLMHVQFSVQERPWVPMVSFGTLTMWGSALFATRGSAKSLLAAGAASGLAFACHQAGLFFLLLCGCAWGLGGGWRGHALRRRLLLGAGCVAVCLVVGVLLGHAYYLRHGLVPEEEIAGFGSTDAQFVAVGGQALRLGFSLASAARLGRAFLGYDSVLLMLGLAGLGAALRMRGTRAAAVYALGYALFFLTSPSDHVRYLLPLVVLLAWPAGLAAERLLRQRAGVALLLLLCTLPLVQALRLGWVLRQPDTRRAGEEALGALASNAPGALVVIDHYGPQPELSRTALERIATKRALRTREAQRLEDLLSGRASGGVDALPAEEVFWVDPASGAYTVRPEWRATAAEPAALLAALGATHFLATDRRPAGHAGLRLARLASTWELVLAIAPGADPREAFLPTEMDFPLTALWQVSRPGPWLGLYALPR
jgi:hypothetical protein